MTSGSDRLINSALHQSRSDCRTNNRDSAEALFNQSLQSKRFAV